MKPGAPSTDGSRPAGPLSPVRLGWNLLRPDALSYVVLFVSNRCNATCEHCFWGDLSSLREEMDTETIGELARALGPLPYLALGGGEPMLRRDLAAIAAQFYERCGTRAISIPTNGILTSRAVALAREIGERFPDRMIKISISLHGLGELQDEILETPGAGRRAAETLDALRALRSDLPGLRVFVNTVFQEANAGRIDEILDHVEGLELDGHTVSLRTASSRAPEVGELDLDRFRHALGRLHAGEVRAPTPVDRLFAGIRETYDDTVLGVLDGTSPTFACTAGRKMLVIREDGTVQACEPRETDSPGRWVPGGPSPRALFDTDAGRAIRDSIPGGCPRCIWGCAILTSISTRPHRFPRLPLHVIGLARGRDPAPGSRP